MKRCVLLDREKSHHFPIVPQHWITHCGQESKTKEYSGWMVTSRNCQHTGASIIALQNVQIEDWALLFFSSVTTS